MWVIHLWCVRLWVSVAVELSMARYLYCVLERETIAQDSGRVLPRLRCRFVGLAKFNRARRRHLLLVDVFAVKRGMILRRDAFIIAQRDGMLYTRE